MSRLNVELEKYAVCKILPKLEFDEDLALDLASFFLESNQITYSC